MRRRETADEDADVLCFFFFFFCCPENEHKNVPDETREVSEGNLSDSCWARTRREMTAAGLSVGLSNKTLN